MAVHAYLQQMSPPIGSRIQAPAYSHPPVHIENRRVAPPIAKQSSRPSSMGFVFEGKSYSTRSAADTYVQILKVFAARFPDFLMHFSKIHAGTRRFVAQNKYDLFPNRPDFAENASRQISDGWWAGLNISRQEIYKRIELACQVVGIAPGKDIIVNLDGD